MFSFQSPWTVRGCAVALAVLARPSLAGDVDSLAAIVKEGEVRLDLRYRFEFVDEDGFDEDAEASTLRSRLSFTSATYRGFSFLAEFDDLTDIGDDDFNSTRNGKVDYPVVADPEGTEVNQAWIRYGRHALSGTYGRQRILHGGERFVGGVGWRQNEQTFDGFRARWESAALVLDYAYVYNVNRIFGPDDGPVQPGDLDGDNHLFRADWKPVENHTLSGFAYLLDIDEARGFPPGRSVDNSSDTYGLQYAGALGPVRFKLAYARQEDGGDSNLSYEADYYLVEAGLALGPVTALAGYEVLAADNGVGFQTPYATLHKFQGWADKFLVTPGDGIEDAYVGLTGALGPVKLGAYYHDFQAEDSGADFGAELDLVATWPVSDLLSLQLKYADFDTDDPARFTDTTKAWLTVQLKL